ncbi:MAG: hypothetical protein Q7S27_03800 [Nanoarchaeota archaeon]|nr:hypothetical protein [Nanoarchaeota archaeon]
MENISEQLQQECSDLEKIIECQTPEDFSFIILNNYKQARKKVMSAPIVNEASKPGSNITKNLFNVCLKNGLELETKKPFLASVAFYIFGERQYKKSIVYLNAYLGMHNHSTAEIINNHRVEEKPSYVQRFALNALRKLIGRNKPIYRMKDEKKDIEEEINRALKYIYQY